MGVLPCKTITVVIWENHCLQGRLVHGERKLAQCLMMQAQWLATSQPGCGVHDLLGEILTGLKHEMMCIHQLLHRPYQSGHGNRKWLLCTTCVGHAGYQ